MAEQVLAGKQKYHKRCFTCNNKPSCNKSLDSGSFNEHDGMWPTLQFLGTACQRLVFPYVLCLKLFSDCEQTFECKNLTCFNYMF